MSVALSYIYYIIRYIGFDYKDRVFVTTDIQSLTLTDCVELGSIVLAYDLAIRIFFVASLLDMLASASICLSFEFNIIFYRLSKLI